MGRLTGTGPDGDDERRSDQTSGVDGGTRRRPGEVSWVAKEDEMGGRCGRRRRVCVQLPSGSVAFQLTLSCEGSGSDQVTGPRSGSSWAWRKHGLRPLAVHRDHDVPRFTGILQSAKRASDVRRRDGRRPEAPPPLSRGGVAVSPRARHCPRSKGVDGLTRMRKSRSCSSSVKSFP